MPPTNSTTRFSNRVADYVKYRPSYPREVLEILGRRAGFSGSSVVADVGAGTGISTQLLLENGARVFAVEPNAEMRAACAEMLGSNPRLTVVDGSAEATTLGDGAVDLVTCFQAFHWFDRVRCRAEFGRILRRGGSVALVWNNRLTEGTPFLREYEEFLGRWAVDYQHVNNKAAASPELIAEFFSPAVFSHDSEENVQRFDWEGLAGRVRSSSYMPAEGDAGYAGMMGDLREVFERNARGGRVDFLYETDVYCGKLG